MNRKTKVRNKLFHKIEKLKTFTVTPVDNIDTIVYREFEDEGLIKITPVGMFLESWRIERLWK